MPHKLHLDSHRLAVVTSEQQAVHAAMCCDLGRPIEAPTPHDAISLLPAVHQLDSRADVPARLIENVLRPVLTKNEKGEKGGQFCNSLSCLCELCPTGLASAMHNLSIEPGEILLRHRNILRTNLTNRTDMKNQRFHNHEKKNWAPARTCSRLRL